MDELLAWRKEFPILGRTVYMISHSLGAMPRRAGERLQEYADTWSTRGIRAWEEGWWEMPGALGDVVGRIIGAGPGEVVMQPNVSISQSIVLSCFDFAGRRNKIVTDDLNFPSNLYIFHAAERQGARVVTVRSPDGIRVPVERLLAAIDEETALVAVSHITYKSSYVQDLEAITRRAHEAGAQVAADLYQSAGSLPVDVGRLGIEFATGGSIKWLCGGPGAGYLYVRRDLWPRLQPRLTGWMAHRDPFAFESGPIEYASNAFRFLAGTPAIPALYAARTGCEIVLEVGVEKIRRRSLEQTARLIALAEEAGFRVRSPRNAAERGGSVIVETPNGQEVTAELLRRDFLVDYRPGAGIRLGPHFYNTDEELDLTIREIRRLSEPRA